MKPPWVRGQSAGRPLPQRPKGCGRGKSGLHRHTVPDNTRRGRPQGKCHRERTASPTPLSPARGGRDKGGARVKRCGKSAPRLRQRRRQGKPHREQDRIGTATRAVRESDNVRGSSVRLAVRVGCSRQCANIVPEEWPSRIVVRKRGGALQNPAYRPADASTNEGFGANTPDPSPFLSHDPEKCVAFFSKSMPSGIDPRHHAQKRS